LSRRRRANSVFWRGNFRASVIAMSLGRVLLCIFLPPLAVLDRGCGSILLVSLLTLVGWVPGVIGAIVICQGRK
jgi:uncharacterized membrane protein YqaE (UPF0057 family)